MMIYRKVWRILAVLSGLIGYAVGWFVGWSVYAGFIYPPAYDGTTIIWWYMMAVGGAVAWVAAWAWQWCGHRWKKWADEHPHVAKEEGFIPYQLVPLAPIENRKEWVIGIYRHLPEDEDIAGKDEKDWPPVESLEPIFVNWHEFMMNIEAHRRGKLVIRKEILHLDPITMRPYEREIDMDAITAAHDIATLEALLREMANNATKTSDLERDNERLLDQVAEVGEIKLKAVRLLAERVGKRLHALVPGLLDAVDGDVSADETLETQLPKFLKILPELRALLLELGITVMPSGPQVAEIAVEAN